MLYEFNGNIYDNIMDAKNARNNKYFDFNFSVYDNTMISYIDTKKSYNDFCNDYMSNNCFLSIQDAINAVK